MSALLTIDQVPRYLRYNWYIRSGYRPPPEEHKSRHSHLLQSIFSWHNETVNIWTHLLALVMFFFLACYEVFLRQQCIRWYVLLSCGACCFVFYGSVIYHGTMNLCKSQREYHQCLNADVMGVLFGATFTAVSPIVSGYRCNHVVLTITAFAVLIYSMFSSAHKILADDVCARSRGKVVGAHAILRTLLSLVSIAGNAWYHMRYQSLAWHTISFLCLIVGGVLNVSRYPEKLFVNKYVSSFFLVERRKMRQALSTFNDPKGNAKYEYHRLLDVIRTGIDFVFNSHQIFHVFVVLSCVTLYYGCVWDDLYYNITFCEATESQTSATVLLQELMLSHGVAAELDQLVFDPSFLYPF